MEINNMDYYADCCQERALYASLPGSNNSALPLPKIDLNLTGSSVSESAATSCQCYQGNQTSNETVPDMSLPSYLFVYVTVTSAIIFLAGVFGNLLVIFVVVRMHSMRTRMNYFLVSLSVADLMVLIVCQPVALLELYARETWLLGAAMCE
ncbi:hypothetical protein V1264_013428 [Littorina saxatilis]|uniref:G-protein coupled receptors family 1 profile domain-containing protein n=1 Tax=Littorina saxatilis TaxID=31220 RepID=A0AAN9BQ02_9CAEN